eukprot:jgi/Galph1/3080/GphlegSOOS_G1712.1
MPNNLVLPGTNSGTSSASSQLNNRRYSWVIVACVLFVGRVMRVIVSWDTLSFLRNSSVSVSFFVFCSFSWASCILCLLQQPWKGKRISKKRLVRVLSGGFIFTVAVLCWLQGLRLCGVFRVLFFDGAELPLVFLYSIVGSRDSVHRQKLRGLILVGLSYLFLFSIPIMFARNDNPVNYLGKLHSWNFEQAQQSSNEIPSGETVSRIEQPSSWIFWTFRGFTTDKNRILQQDYSVSRMQTSVEVDAPETDLTIDMERSASEDQKDVIEKENSESVFSGFAFATISCILFVVYRVFSMKVSTHLDGPKRIFAISNLIATLLLLPVCIFQRGMRAEWVRPEEWSSLCAHSFSFAFGWIVLPFYTQSFVSSKMGHLGSSELNFGCTICSLFIFIMLPDPNWIHILEFVCSLLQLLGIHSLLAGRSIRSFDSNSTLEDF